MAVASGQIESWGTLKPRHLLCLLRGGTPWPVGLRPCSPCWGLSTAHLDRHVSPFCSLAWPSLPSAPLSLTMAPSSLCLSYCLHPYLIITPLDPIIHLPHQRFLVGRFVRFFWFLLILCLLASLCAWFAVIQIKCVCVFFLLISSFVTLLLELCSVCVACQQTFMPCLCHLKTPREKLLTRAVNRYNDSQQTEHEFRMNPIGGLRHKCDESKTPLHSLHQLYCFP